MQTNVLVLDKGGVYYEDEKVDAKKNVFATLFFLIVMAFALVFIFGSTKASADSRHRENDRKFFTSYVVESQDTLWGIAWQYITPEYDSMDEYIHSRALRDSTRIYPGQLIPYPLLCRCAYVLSI